MGLNINLMMLILNIVSINVKLTCVIRLEDQVKRIQIINQEMLKYIQIKLIMMKNVYNLNP